MKNTIGILRKLLPVVALSAVVSTLNLFPAKASTGADTFKTNCEMCHGPDGSGATPIGQQLKLRDLRSSEVQKKTNAELTAAISDGKAPMPAYGQTLSSAEIHQLVVFIRSIAAKK